MSRVTEFSERNGFEAAIIGLACRFPQANDAEQFWENLRGGIESIAFFSEEDLKSRGVDPAILKHPNFVNAGGILERIEYFDAAFFGYSPREAEIIDPQHRIFLECAWNALENAGYNPETYRGLIGVYAGCGLNSYSRQIMGDRSRGQQVTGLQALISNDKDHLTTRVSYKLGLKGPSVTVQTACSTSLVAVQMAHQALLCGVCDIALAGGVSIRLQQKTGYFWQEGGIMSPDGHCRAFDAMAQGTVGGSGAGIVVLKRLEDALADGDFVHAVIKGSAINNDGSSKVGYTAPSIEGQARVIRAAQAMAEIEAETISYIETHGTGTALGDPIEITALTDAFRAKTSRRRFCAVGSVKTNIGHLDTAAGVAGLIKTTLALERRLIPPSINYERPNPKIDFENSPVYVNTTLTEWKGNGHSLRAGVSSFGIGGTNAHVILEEAPPAHSGESARSWQLITLSARSEPALQTLTTNLIDYFKRHPDLNIADAAYTLHVGRKAFSHRQVLVCRDLDDAITALERLDPERVWRSDPEPQERPVAFMFPGQGSQYVRMGADLYQEEPIFREQIDLCAELFEPYLDLDLRQLLYPDEERTPTATAQLNQTLYTQPALFAVEYALAKMWMAYGIHPQAMIGHSVGEYVAACLAEVFTLEDAAALIAVRARLMQGLPNGAMLSVPLSESEVERYLDGRISLAAVNGPSRCVVSGPVEVIDRLEQELAAEHKFPSRLQTSHAFHSRMMDPILAPLSEQATRLKLKPPKIPYVSNLTGAWITDGEATNPEYWASHLRQAVRFSEGLAELLVEPHRILLEAGPGEALCALARRYPTRSTQQVVLSSIRHPALRQSDEQFLLNTLGKLWLSGANVGWEGFHRQERRRRLPLPGFPFERQRYWVDIRQQPDAISAQLSTPIERSIKENRAAEEEVEKGRIAPDRRPLRKKPDIADWFYAPVWKQTAPGRRFSPQEFTARPQRWMVFIDECGIGATMARRLASLGQDVVIVRPGAQYRRIGDRYYAINPGQRAHYDQLLGELQAQNALPQRIVHLWSVDSTGVEQIASTAGEKILELSFYSLLFLTQALGERLPSLTEADQDIFAEIHIAIVSNNLQLVSGEEPICPEKATLLGPCRVIPLEYPKIACRSVDIVLPATSERLENLTDRLIEEFITISPEAVVAYRGPHRWTQVFEPVRLEQRDQGLQRLREGGVYLITGGLGGIGLALAEHLARQARAKLILTGRTPFPMDDEWDEWLATHAEQNEISQKIRKLKDIKALGAEVLTLCVDVADEQRMRAEAQRARERFGPINGVIHAAGIPPKNIIQRRSADQAAAVLAPKVQGTRVLEILFGETDLDFIALCSSQRSIMGGSGAVDYTAANAFLDAYARRNNFRSGVHTISIIWDAWRDVGMSVGASKRILPDEGFGAGITSAEGQDVFSRILASPLPEVIVSMHDLQRVIEQNWAFARMRALIHLSRPSHPRPALAVPYTAPSHEAEMALADIWQELLGIDKIGVHDNFFELGGDSVISIRVVAKANQAGLRLTPQQVFEFQTIAQLAVAADTGPAAQHEQGAVTGQVPLTPLQHWFFEQNLPSPHHWNQAILLEVREVLDRALLEKVWQGLLVHHDALRHRFRRAGEAWEQVCVVPGELAPLELSDLTEIEESAVVSAIEAEATRLQTSLDLSTGPLARMAYFDLGRNRPGRLLIIAHHLLSDAISWRILLEDLQTAYQQLGRGGTIQLPPKTTSVQHWAQRLEGHAQTAAIQAESKYWFANLRANIPPLPLDFSNGENTVSSARTLTDSLTPEETRAVLQDMPHVHETQIDDALLTALVLTFAGWTRETSLLVNLEGHGRDPIFEDLDLSRTIGWFTTLYPVLLECNPDHDPYHTLVKIKEQRRRIPKSGVGYGLLRYLGHDREMAAKLAAYQQSQVSFLYLGQSQQGSSKTSLFAPAGESIGPKRDPLGRRHHLIEATASASRGQLRLSWTYSENLHRSSTIEALSRRYLETLRALTNCHPPLGQCEQTSPDFPLAGVSRNELERAFSSIEFEER